MILCLLPLGVGMAQAAQDGWQFVANEQGVVASKRMDKGRTHPTLRGQTTVEGDILHVLAVVLDSKRATRWVRGADATAIIRDIPPTKQVVYMFTDLPWPIRDRDMVMERSVEIKKPGQEFVVHFDCAPKERGQDRSALRISQCASHFSLRRIDDQRTAVEYQVYLDPGGGLPSWTVGWFEKRVTVDTLARLQRQVRRTKGEYADVMKRWRSAPAAPAPTTASVSTAAPATAASVAPAAASAAAAPTSL